MAQMLGCCGCGRPAAVALIGPLAWEPPHAKGVPLKKPPPKKNTGPVLNFLGLNASFSTNSPVTLGESLLTPPSLAYLLCRVVTTKLTIAGGSEHSWQVISTQ